MGMVFTGETNQQCQSDVKGTMVLLFIFMNYNLLVVLCISLYVIEC